MYKVPRTSVPESFMQAHACLIPQGAYLRNFGKSGMPRANSSTPQASTKQKALQIKDLQGFYWNTKYKIRTYDPIRVKDVLYHWANFAFLFRPLSGCGEIIHESLTECKSFFIFFCKKIDIRGNLSHLDSDKSIY